MRVPDDSKVVGMSLHAVESELEDALIVGLIRNNVHMHAPAPNRRIRQGDILVVEADVESLSGMLSALGLALEEADNTAEDGTGTTTVTHTDVEQPPPDSTAEHQGDGLSLMELVVRTESPLQGRSARGIQLRERYGVNLLALSREGSRFNARLQTLKIRPGDLLLVQGTEGALNEFAADSNCIPLAERELRLPEPGQALKASLIMLASVGAAAFSLLPTAIAFAAGVLASMALRTLPLRSVYTAIDWPVIVLLGALMPVAAVMESSGTAQLISESLLQHVAQGSSLVAIALILVLTMLISSVVNNAATAAAMCPIALGTAASLGVNADAFLMAVAIGASCAFLTPIGHQNNTLILGPGGFRFGDYWRLGLPVSLIVVGVSLPLLLYVWPL
ncbi:SLC13 family permease [Marinobacterium weihaiense]|uniref:SLC13 family permease n=1 Tax=Marinobacterium weihaiense TaxID=2851016 RepID=UPI002E1FF07F